MARIVQAISVADLIEHLKKFPQDLPVCYEIHSEQALLELGDIQIEELCMPRADGWVQNKRPDKFSQSYLVFPGN